MASRIFNEVKTMGYSTIAMPGSFRPIGTSAPVAVDAKTRGWAVSRVGAGHYRITLEDSFAELVSAIVSLRLASSAATGDTLVSYGDWTPASKTLDIYTWGITGAALADLADDADNVVNFVLYFRNGTI